jgi:hypothetical protein
VDGAPRGYDVVTLETAIAEPPGRPHQAIRISERTSWSCHHGVLRWSADCPCATDGRWKAPLRAALDRLAAGIDALTERVADDLAGSPDPWAARDDYVDVVIGRVDEVTFARERIGGRSAAVARDAATLAILLEAQRWRLAMFASDGWFWDDPTRPETAGVLRSAAKAARLVDGLAGSRLERRLADDLALLSSPGHHFDGAAIYDRALAAVGQLGIE